jgi:purine nucleosidase
MPASSPPRPPVVLDTDIGSDVDDLLALVMLALAPEVRLLGVTTVYGDTVLRARIVRDVCAALGRPEIAIAPGAQATLAGRPVWWAGHEGQGIPRLEEIALGSAEEAGGYLRRVARAHAGDLELFAIGPLTNIAAVIETDAGFARAVRHLFIMGGLFWREATEHNIRCDPEAADIVFRSGIPITACGLDVTTRFTVGEREARAIGRAHGALGPVLEDQIRRCWAVQGRAQNTPHDPVAILMALEPEHFTFASCHVRVGLGETDLGRTSIARCGDGTVRVARDVDLAAARARLLQRLTGQS